MLDSATAWGGDPSRFLRMSSADERDGNYGVSHHSRTALDLTTPVAGARGLARGRCLRPPPPRCAPHRCAPMADLLDAAGLAVTTMGRGQPTIALLLRGGRSRRRAGRRSAAGLDRVATVSTAKLERLLKPHRAPLDTTRPITADDIQAQLEAYPRDQGSFDGLRAGQGRAALDGHPVACREGPGHDARRRRLRIPRDEYALRDPGSTPTSSRHCTLPHPRCRWRGCPPPRGS